MRVHVSTVEEQLETLPEIEDRVATGRRLRHLNEPINAGERVQLHRRKGFRPFSAVQTITRKPIQARTCIIELSLKAGCISSPPRTRRVSAPPERDPSHLARQTTSLAQDGLGRERGLDHDHPLCSYWRGNRARSTSASLPNFNNGMRPVSLHTVDSSALQLPDASDTDFSFFLRARHCRKAGPTTSVSVAMDPSFLVLCGDSSTPPCLTRPFESMTTQTSACASRDTYQCWGLPKDEKGQA